MSENPRQKRERLFNLYSRNLAQYHPQANGLFLCPLCWRMCPREGLTTEPPLLTLAHIVPRCLGGTTYTLTCAPCNNGNGTGLERALQEQFRLEDWGHGLGSIDARLNVEGRGDISVQFRRDPDGAFEFHVAEGRSNPANVRETRGFLECMRAGPNPGFSNVLRWRGLNAPHRVNAAVYHSAYLLLFRHFGYEAVGHRHFRPIREWLQAPDSAGWEPRIMVMHEETGAHLLTANQHALAFPREPRVILAVLRFAPEGGRPRVFGALLPGLDSPDVPDVSTGTFDCGVIPYQPGALTHGPGYLRAAWGHYDSVFQRPAS